MKSDWKEDFEIRIREIKGTVTVDDIDKKLQKFEMQQINKTTAIKNIKNHVRVLYY